LWLALRKRAGYGYLTINPPFSQMLMGNKTGGVWATGRVFLKRAHLNALNRVLCIVPTTRPHLENHQDGHKLLFFGNG
jgi:hypothetical protein